MRAIVSQRVDGIKKKSFTYFPGSKETKWSALPILPKAGRSSRFALYVLLDIHVVHIIICLRNMLLEAFMRTTLAIKEELLNEVKMLSGEKTKKGAVEKALEEFIKRRKAKKLLELEGKIDLSLTTEELIAIRRKDVPHR